MASYIQDTNRGLLVADTQSILSDVQTEFKNALGATMSTQASTPQGLLIAGETISRSGVMRNNVELANEINPDVSQGIFLDAILGLMGSQRRGDTKTQVAGVVLTGVPDRPVTIPAGYRCASPSGTVFQLQSTTVIPAGLTATAVFVSQENGAFDIGTLPQPWRIIDGVIGWDTCIVPIGANITLGSTEMLDPEARMYRKRTLAAWSKQSVRAAFANVSVIPGVTSMSARENVEQTPQTIDGVVFTRGNALWVCVDGGLDSEIGTALLESKGCGSGYDSGTGSGTPVTTSVVDPSSGQTYSVKFTRPSPLAGIPVFTRAYIRQGTSMANPLIAVTDAILAWAAGLQDNEEGLVLGHDFSAFEVAGAIQVGVPGTYVRLCEVSTNGTTWTSVIPMALWQKGYLPRGNITVILES